jgi:hypothetical protein
VARSAGGLVLGREEGLGAEVSTYLEDVIRKNAAAWAAAQAPCSADPASPDCARYLELVAPGETPRRAAEMATMSGCALWAGRGYLRHVLARCPASLAGPYTTGRAPLDIHDAADVAEAIRPAAHPVELGDVVHLAGNAAAGEHVYVVVGVAPAPYGYGPAQLVDSVDGGQRRGGYQAILARQRVIAPMGVGAEDQLIDGPTRAVWRVYDLGALVRCYGAAPAVCVGG